MRELSLDEIIELAYGRGLVVVVKDGRLMIDDEERDDLRPTSVEEEPS